VILFLAPGSGFPSRIFSAPVASASLIWLRGLRSGARASRFLGPSSVDVGFGVPFREQVLRQVGLCLRFGLRPVLHLSSFSFFRPVFCAHAGVLIATTRNSRPALPIADLPPVFHFLGPSPICRCCRSAAGKIPFFFCCCLGRRVSVSVSAQAHAHHPSFSRFDFFPTTEPGIGFLRDVFFGSLVSALSRFGNSPDPPTRAGTRWIRLQRQERAHQLGLGFNLISRAAFGPRFFPPVGFAVHARRFRAEFLPSVQRAHWRLFLLDISAKPKCSKDFSF
jgi:hypothetical protein